VVADWDQVCRLIVGHTNPGTARSSTAPRDYSWAWAHRKRGANLVGLYLEPSAFPTLGRGEDVTRSGAAIDLGVRLNVDGSAADQAGRLLDVLRRVDPALGAERAIYPNATRDEHGRGRVVVCMPPSAQNAPTHENWDRHGVWLCLGCDVDDLVAQEQRGVDKVVERLAAQLPRFRKAVELAVAYYTPGLPRRFSFQELLGWCGEYVVWRRLHGLRWIGGYEAYDFRAIVGEEVLEVKTTTIDSVALPRFSLNEVRASFRFGRGYRVARVRVDATVVRALEDLLRGLDGDQPAQDAPEWVLKLAVVTRCFVAEDERVRQVLADLERSADMRLYRSPFGAEACAGLAATLNGDDAVFGEGTVEVRLSDALAEGAAP
jgi:hypothetical protein